MKSSGIALFVWLALLALAAGVAVGADSAPPASPVLPPTPPLSASPVATFRKLLDLAPAERAAELDRRPERQRAILLSRLAEYELLPPAVREERLRATDLYWHLQQLIRRSAGERARLVAAAPPDLRPILAERLALWDRLPPADQSLLAEHEQAIRYLARVKPLRAPPLPGTNAAPTRAIPAELEVEFNRLSALPAASRKRAFEQWRLFFDAPAPRHDRALDSMSEAERREIEGVLNRFRRLSPEQRHACVDAFTRFATMPAGERNAFLKQAERWEALPPADRAAWRRIVGRLPILPPLPINSSQPPIPPTGPVPRLLSDLPK